MIDAYLKKAEEAEEQERRKKQEAEETERDSQEAERPPSAELGLGRSSEEEVALSTQSSHTIEEAENEVENGDMMDTKLAVETEGTKNEECRHSEDIEATHEVTQRE